MCAYCSNAPATKRCSICSFAHYCGRECQTAHWPVHKRPCHAGDYIASIEAQTRKQAELLKSGGVAEEVIKTMQATLEMAKDAGDAEGERHLSVALAFRCDALAEALPSPVIAENGFMVDDFLEQGRQQKATQLQEAAVAYRQRAVAIEEILGPALEPKELLSAVSGGSGCVYR